MLARLRGFTAVPQQAAQHGSRREGQNPGENAGRNGVAIVPWIQRRFDRLGGGSDGVRLRLQNQRPRRGGRVGSAGPGAAGLAPGLGALLAATLGACWLNPLRAEPAPRPPDLKILVEKTTMREGTHWLGVYGRVAEADQPGLWRVKLWREWSDRVEISTETIDCRPGSATRAGVTASKVVVQTLNPGGPINPANRLDHLIWWATCYPEQAGRDPAGLAPLARSLGFDGRQQEHFEVLSVPPLPHP